MLDGNFGGIISILAGLFTVSGAYFNWDWFMNNYRARFFVDIFGRGGARVFYFILGGFLVVVGFTLLF